MPREELPELCPVDDSPEIRRVRIRPNDSCPWKTTVEYGCGCIYEDRGEGDSSTWIIRSTCPNAHDTAIQLRQPQQPIS